MAKAWYDNSGNILAVVNSDASPYGPPQTFAGVLSFDETVPANAAVLADFHVNNNLYTCPAGVLKKSGNVVALAADSTAVADAKAVKANLAPLFAALRAGTATSAQQQRVLAFLLRQFLQG